VGRPSADGAAAEPGAGTAGAVGRADRLARRGGFAVWREYCGHGVSTTIWRAGQIRVHPGLGDTAAAQALAHEIGHILLDCSVPHPPGSGTSGSRGAGKVQAGAVGLLVTGHAGMDTTGYSFPDVGSWAGTDPRAQPEAAIVAARERIAAAAATAVAYIDCVLPPPVREMGARRARNPVRPSRRPAQPRPCGRELPGRGQPGQAADTSPGNGSPACRAS
jgi:hypothetical protein